jgi:hypothetical protein
LAFTFGLQAAGFSRKICSQQALNAVVVRHISSALEIVMKIKIIIIAFSMLCINCATKMYLESSVYPSNYIFYPSKCDSSKHNLIIKGELDKDGWGYYAIDLPDSITKSTYTKKYIINDFIKYLGKKETLCSDTNVEIISKSNSDSIIIKYRPEDPTLVRTLIIKKHNEAKPFYTACFVVPLQLKTEFCIV